MTIPTYENARSATAPLVRSGPGTTLSNATIIACVDSGRGGRAVARLAEGLAMRMEASLLLATVRPATARIPSADEVATARGLLNRVASELALTSDKRIVFGDPAERLISLAQREAASLIITSGPDPSSPSPGLFDNLFLAFARGGPCPVVIVPPQVETYREAIGPVVCEIDGSDASARAAGVATELGYALGTGVALMDVTTPVRGRDVAAVAARLGAQMVVTAARVGRSEKALRSTLSLSQLATSVSCPLVVVPARARAHVAYPAFSVHVQPRAACGTIVSVHGEVDIATAPALERETYAALASGNDQRVLDLSGTTLLALAGIRVTERLAYAASERGRPTRAGSTNARSPSGLEERESHRLRTGVVGSPDRDPQDEAPWRARSRPGLHLGRGLETALDALL